jgi:hypothetical protein
MKIMFAFEQNENRSSSCHAGTEKIHHHCRKRDNVIPTEQGNHSPMVIVVYHNQSLPFSPKHSKGIILKAIAGNS